MSDACAVLKSAFRKAREIESHCCVRGCVSVCKTVRSGKIKTVEIENEQIEGLRTETCVILTFSPRAAGKIRLEESAVRSTGWRDAVQTGALSVGW